MALPLIMAGMAMAKGATDAYANEQRRKSQRRAFQKLSEVTPSEREYQKHLRSIAESGDPAQNQLMSERMNRVLGNIRQTGAEQLQRTQGSIIGQGLENSIVAQELRRKVDKDTMRSIAEQSRRISAENMARQEATKRQAEERLHQFNIGLDSRKQQMDANIAQLGGNDRWGTLANIAQSGLETYIGSGGMDLAEWERGKTLRDKQWKEELNRFESKEKAKAPTFIYGNQVDTSEWE
tara:strand:+ start:350 stop:1060 length:711 start_codon:yes stop_codon:yes gene_type:complete